MKNPKRLNSLFSPGKQQGSEGTLNYGYEKGITKTLLAKYKPSESLKILEGVMKERNEQIAA